MIDANLTAAIIGYWRQGVFIEQIILITGLWSWEIEQIIESHQIKIQNETINN